MPAAFDVSELVNLADDLRTKAGQTDEALRPTFDRWAEDVADVMRDEIPKETEETANSVTVEAGQGLSATVGPTNTDERGRPVGFFINYGTGAQAPDDFIGRTAARAPQALGDFDVREVL